MMLRGRIHHEGGAAAPPPAAPPAAPPPAEPDASTLKDQDRSALIATITELRNERRDLRGRLTGFETAADTHKAAATGLQAELAALRAELETTKSAHADELVMVGIGLDDPDLQAALRSRYSREPEDGRPASLGEYVAALKGKMDGETAAEVPGWLHPFLAGAGPAGAPSTPKPRNPPRQHTPPSGDAHDALIRAARERQDWPEVARLTGMNRK